MGDLSDNSSVEGELSFNGNNGILADKAEEHVDKNIELHCHVSDSPTKREVSRNCINLFVEVFGPSDDVDEGYNDLNGRSEHAIPGSRESDQEYVRNENGTVSKDVKITSFKNEDECVFNVTDVVWAKARTQTWWPGKICDPSSDAAKDAAKSEKRGPFLVKYFGNPYFTWCSNSDMRPFAEYFEQMSGQNDSRNFLGSVDKALGEIGRRVKSKMTCRCFFKESLALPAHFSSEDSEKSPPPMDSSKFDTLCLSEFKPLSLFSYIRNLASGFCIPNKVELTVAKNRLSAFYCSLGHRQLPMNLLGTSCNSPQNAHALDNLMAKAIDDGQNTSEDVKGFEKSGYDNDLKSTVRKRKKNQSDGKLISSGKEHELRERKKSKYLSYPYIDGDQNGKISTTVGQNITDDPKNLSCGSPKSTPSSKLTGKNSQKKRSRNSFKGHHIVSKVDDIDSCSAQLLAELRSFALDYFYPTKSNCFDSLKRFYCSFRTFAFLDFEMDHGTLESPKVPTGSTAKVQKKGKGKEKVKESGKGVHSASVIDNASNEVPEKDDQQEKMSSKRVAGVIAKGQKKGKGKEKVKESGKNQGTNSASVIDNANNEEQEKDNQQEKGSSKCVIGAISKVRKKRKGKEKVKEPGKNLGIDYASVIDNANNEEQKDYQQEGSSERVTGAIAQVQEKGKGKVREPGKNQGIDGATAIDNGSNQEAEKYIQQEEGSNKRVTAEKKEEVLLIAGVEPAGNSLNISDAVTVKNLYVISFQPQGSDIPKNKTVKKRKEAKAGPMHLQFETETTFSLPDLNGNIASISFENMTPGTSAMLQDTQNINGTERSSCSGYPATELMSNLIHDAIDSSFHNSIQKVLLPSNGKPERKKWKRKSKTSQVAPIIPDLNGTTLDSPSLEKIPSLEDHTSLEGDRPQKKRRTSCPNEDPGAMLRLNFALGHPLPSKETLVATFSRFGLLKESETQFLDDSSVQIFYERTSDAQFAIRRLEKNNPFVESLVSFKFHQLASTPTMGMMETVEKTASTVGRNHKKLHLPQPFSPADTIKVPSPKEDAPNLTFIKKNVEMMKMTLEKAGDNLSLEMRVKLENEIKGFLNKIAVMDSASAP